METLVTGIRRLCSGVGTLREGTERTQNTGTFLYRVFHKLTYGFRGIIAVPKRGWKSCVKYQSENVSLIS
jgi:hypothetical protein